MANVLNSEPESTTLNTELETPTLDPAMENEMPSPESTSNHDTAEAPSTAEAVSSNSLDADDPSTPVTDPPSSMLQAETREAQAHAAESEPVAMTAESAENAR